MLFRRRELIPHDRLAALESEGFVVREGSVSTTLRFEDYRAPGRYSGLRKTRVRSAFVVTRVRLAVYVRGPFVDVPFTDERFELLDLRTTEDGVVIGFDPHLFDERSSGRVDVTCRVPDPQRVMQEIQALRQR